MATIDFGPAVLNLDDVYAGDAQSLLVTVTESGVPVGLTGATIESEVRETPIAPDPPTLTGGVTLVDAVNGQFSLSWPAADLTTALDGAAEFHGVWDVQMTELAAPDPVTLLRGRFTIRSDVTRP